MFGINLEEPFWILIIGQLIIEELRSSTEDVSLGPIGQPPAQGPVGDAANENIQHVLDQDVDSVLRSHGPSFQEGEAALHEEDDDGNNNQEHLIRLLFQHR